jgi:hypothetical protein
MPAISGVKAAQFCLRASPCLPSPRKLLERITASVLVGFVGSQPGKIAVGPVGRVLWIRERRSLTFMVGDLF